MTVTTNSAESPDETHPIGIYLLSVSETLCPYISIMSFLRHSLRSNTVMSWSGRRATNNTVDVRNYSRFYRGNLSVLTGSNYNTIVGPNSSSTTRNTTFKALAVPPHGVLTTTTTTRSSSLSTTPTPEDPQAQFKARPPSELTMEMAEGIQNANHLIVRYGVGAQRLKLLAQDGTMPLILKWQRMMEIYLGAQLHVIAALGYEPNEHGIMLYTQHLAQFITNKCEPSKQDTFRAVGRDTWRHMLVTAFDLDIAMIKEKYGEEMSIVDARNTVHKVASKLIEPRILDMVATKVAQIPPRKYYFGVIVQLDALVLLYY